MDWNDLFSYDSSTGILTWRVRRPGGRSKNVGEAAGSVIGGRYLSVHIERKRRYVHRVIWEMVNGPLPTGMCIDHIDGNGLNNRLDNLRLTTLSSNQRNRRLSRNNSTGVQGVFVRRNGYEVRCGSEYIGHFKSFETAVSARRSAAAQRGYIERAQS